MTTATAAEPGSSRLAGEVERYSLDVVVTRGDLVEQEHLIHVAIVDAEGRIVGAARDPQVRAHWRSCAKPFQQMPFVAADGLRRLRWGAEYLALACGSHLGEPRHVDLVRLMLRSVGATEEDLVCGPTEPQSERGEEYLEKAGKEPGKLHNTCSGKHAAMIACCVLHDWGFAGYHTPDHPLQQRILSTVAEWTDVPQEEIVVATDGCGLPEFGLPLDRMALAYARLVSRSGRSSDVAHPIVEAMAEHPFFMGGSEAYDTQIIEEPAGNVIAKEGADGIACFGIRDQELGIALYALAANKAAKHAAALRLLQRLGTLPGTLSESLQECLRSAQTNTRGEVVGELHVREQ